MEPGKSDKHRGSVACNLAHTSCCKSRGLKDRFWGVDVHELGLGESNVCTSIFTIFSYAVTFSH